MNELGLPPHDREPAFAADEVAYAAVVGRALTRRRVRALATTSATGVAAVAAVVALSGSAAGGRAIVQPVDAPTPAASSGSPMPGAPAPGRSSDPAPDLVVGSLGPDPMVVFPVPGESPPPYPGDGPTYVPRDRPRPEWGESVATVADRPEAECDIVEPTDAWCFRYLGPKTIVAGEVTTFAAELCRRPGRGVNRVELAHEHELSVLVAGEELVAMSPAGAARAHHRLVADGRCLRWSKTWNGIGDRGTKPPSGTYEVFVGIAGYTPHEPLPNAGSQEDRTEYLYRGPVEVEW